jgi:hypothetical protein
MKTLIILCLLTVNAFAQNATKLRNVNICVFTTPPEDGQALVYDKKKACFDLKKVTVESTTPPPEPVTGVDIKTYGVKCDGSDDSAAVQKALDAIVAEKPLNFTCMASIRQINMNGKSGVKLYSTNGGGLRMLSGIGDVWGRAFNVRSCSSCVFENIVFEGNNQDIIPFTIEESNNSTVQITVRNVRHAGAAIQALHNTSNKYIKINMENVGMDRGPAVDTTRGLWIGNVSPETMETNPLVDGGTFTDISGSAIVVHGTNMTVTNNKLVRLNASCVKMQPLGPETATSTIQNNDCSGAGAKYWIGGGMMTEYPTSAKERVRIINNKLKGYAESDVTRVLDCPNNGLGIANGDGKTSYNVEVVGNTFEDFKYASVQFTGSTTGFLVERNLMKRTFPGGDQQYGLEIQGDANKVYQGGTVRNNWIIGKMDGINLGGNRGLIDGVTFSNNSIEKSARDGLHVEVVNGGTITNIPLSGMCYSQIGYMTIWDNRTPPMPAPPQSATCPDPR